MNREREREREKEREGERERLRERVSKCERNKNKENSSKNIINLKLAHPVRRFETPRDRFIPPQLSKMEIKIQGEITKSNNSCTFIVSTLYLNNFGRTLTESLLRLTSNVDY